jgi:hypothetical protein
MMLRNALLFAAISLFAVVALARAREETSPPLIIDPQPVRDWNFTDADIEQARPDDPRLQQPTMRLYTTCPLDRRNVPIIKEIDT